MWLSLASVAWTTVAGGTALAIGIAGGSVVLVVFACVGFVDGVGSASLANHFRHGSRHGELADHLERLSHQIVVTGLVLVGTGAVVAGLVRLVGREEVDASGPGTAVAAASLVVLAVLSISKVRVAREVGSAALRSDGHLSMVGAAQSGVTLVGVAAAGWGWWWADPSGAIVIGLAATTVGVRAWRSARHG